MQAQSRSPRDAAAAPVIGIGGKAIYTFDRGCTFLVDHDTEWCATDFPDKARAEGKVERGAGVENLAQRLGLSLWDRVWQHELIHTWLAEAMGLDHSPTLRAVADGWTSPPDGMGIRNEEAMTEAVHFLFIEGHLPWLARFMLNPDWQGSEWPSTR